MPGLPHKQTNSADTEADREPRRYGAMPT